MQYSSLSNAIKFLVLGVLLLGLIFLIPDAGQLEHRSFFSVAQHSHWAKWFEWPAAWCSAKIIVLSLSALFILEASLTVAMRAKFRTVGTVLMLLCIPALLLGSFGLYELAKAVL